MSENTGKEMSFMDHLEELRWHLLRGVVAIFVFMIIAFINMKFIFKHVILAPARADFWTYKIMCKLSDATCIDQLNFSLQSRLLSGQFTMHVVASFTVGFIVGFPYLFYEIWKFIKPGLYINEKKNATGVVLFVTILFIIGALFGYFVIAPLSVNFLANYTLDESIVNEFDITSYVGTICMIVLAGGLMFQLPVVVMMLSKFGVVTPQFMRRFRKHAIVVLMIVAAIITPSPDVLSQILVGIPLYILYELSIFISAVMNRGRTSTEIQKQEKE
jgi:sec-independent protein translocase protein TatC